MTQRNNEYNPFSSIPSILVFVLVLMGLWYFSGFLINILYYVIAPILLIATLIVNPKVVLSFGKWMMNLFKTNFVYGLGAAIFTFFLYPFVVGFLFGKAMFIKKVNELTGNTTQQVGTDEEGYTEYEEVEEEPTETLDLPSFEKAPKPESENRYEDLFGDNS